MATKPMLFNTEMIRAILSGEKTCTRRINKDGGELSEPDMSFYDPGRRTYAIHNYEDRAHTQQMSLVEAPVPICPGDILYVRETWSGTTLGNAKVGYTDLYWYKADDKYENPDDKWRPSIHMPMEAARIFLRVTGVRVERLQSMTAEDSLREGVKLYLKGVLNGEPPLAPFAQFWDSTIKSADFDHYGWAANPWVWVIEFERISKEAALGGDGDE